MQPLATTKRIMTWLCMCPSDESTSRQKRVYIAYSSAVLIINLISFSASLAYCIQFFYTDFEGAAFAFMVDIAGVGLIYSMIIAILMRQQILNIFTCLSTIYNSSKNQNMKEKFIFVRNDFSPNVFFMNLDVNDVSFRFLTQANNRSEWMWTIYFKYIAISIINLGITSIISIIYCYSTRGNLDVNHFYHPDKYVYVFEISVDSTVTIII